MPQTDAPASRATAGSRLRWWTELPLIAAVYAVYELGRMLARSDTSGAVDHGLAILRAERRLHLNAEEPLNRIFAAHISIGLPADFWYATLHYVITPVIAVWLYRTCRAHYRQVRTWLLVSTLIGLVGFTLLPTCPPRLLAASHGFVDIMKEFSSYGWWGGQASAPRGMGDMTNQYAAMPSLHVGWALWCGVMLWRHGRGPWARVAAVGYPLVTTVVVVGTANHYLLDAVAGVAVMGVGLLLTRPALWLADAIRPQLAARLGPVRAAATARLAIGPGQPRRAAGSAIVGDGCQTSAGERIPRQRKQLAEPGPPPADPGDGAAAAAR